VRPYVSDPKKDRDGHERKSNCQSIDAGRWVKVGTPHPNAEVGSQKENRDRQRSNRGNQESYPCQSCGFGHNGPFRQA
jgi:hypothetical protein